MSVVVRQGIIAGILEVSYILLAAGYVLLSEDLWQPGSRSLIFGIASVLIMLVTSVAVSGLLVLGYPAYYFLQKQYRAGVVFLSSCLITLLIIFILILLGEIFIY